MPDGRNRRRVQNTSVVSIFDGDFILYVFESRWTYAARYYVDGKERIVYVRSIIREQLFL